MKLGNSSEAEFLHHIHRDVGRASGLVRLGIGDDAAVVACPEGHSLVLSCDAAVEGRHFTREWFSPREIGARAVAAAMSDIAAMGATPAAALLALAISPDESLQAARDIVAGAAEMAEDLGACLAGGETVATNGPLVLDVSVSGFVPSGRELRRDAATPGDLLLVSGALGASAAGLEALRSGQASSPVAKRAAVRYRRPQPRMALAPLLSASDGVQCAIDVSDGLVRDAAHIAQESRVGIRIEAEGVPVAEEAADLAAALSADALHWTLTGGEDFELLFTARPDAVDELVGTALSQIDLRLTVIGEVVAGSGVEVRGKDGRPIDPPRAGWDHFSVG